MSRFAAEALGPDGELERRTWVPGETLRLRAAAGAEAVLVRFFDGERAAGLLEVEVTGGEPVALALGENGRPVTDAAPLLRLPPETTARRPRKTSAIDGGGLDLAVVVDATRLHLEAPGEDSASVALPMLESEPWAAERAGLARLAGRLADHCGEARFSVLAFADRESPFPVAEDLRPAYRLAPALADRRFEAFSPAGLERRLAALRPSPGGDAVDAVAEGLLAAVDLPWRAGARRLVLLLGDSPGYSISDSLPVGAASSARRQSLEQASAALFAHAIELATFFLPPASELIAADTWRELLRHAERQYRRLASLPEWAFRLDPGALEDFDAPEHVLDPPEWLGHGATLGFFC